MLMIVFLGLLCSAAVAEEETESNKEIGSEMDEAVNKIYGGEVISEDRQNEVSYQAFVRPKNKPKEVFGAAILTNQHVITSGYRVSKPAVTAPSDIEVGAGVVKLDASNPPPRIRQVLKINIHPNYKFPFNNIAVLEIESFGVLDKTVSKITIAPKRPPAGTSCQISGWGRTGPTHGAGDVSNDLRSVETLIIATPECKKHYGSSFNEKTHICAGIGQFNADANEFDQGGALMCNDVAAGIFSLGQTKRPGLYEDLTQFKDWLSAFKDLPPGATPTTTTTATTGNPTESLAKGTTKKSTTRKPAVASAPERSSNDAAVHDYVTPVYLVSYFICVVFFQ